MIGAELFAKWHPRILEEVSKLMVIARYLEAGGIVETLLKIDEALKSLHFKVFTNLTCSLHYFLSHHCFFHSITSIPHTFLQVSVLSVIKTGKTTFLNAILGAEFLPATTLYCTSSHLLNHQ